MTWPDLRPCPFCGGVEARLIPLDDEGYEMLFDNREEYEAGDTGTHEDFCRRVEENTYMDSALITCPCGASFRAPSIDGAIEGWNKREGE